MERLRIAVAGSGISGLTAAHVLAPHHDVTVFEAEPRPGGHTHTVEVEHAGRAFSLDTGFIVFNDRNYPGFCRLLDELGVAREPTSMSFSVRVDATGLEYNGRSLDGLFVQRRNLLRPGFYRMLADIVRFARLGRRLLAEPDGDLTLGAFLERERFSRGFQEHYLIPMGAALWSAEPARMREFPAVTFVRFFERHGMLGLGNRPRWFVVRGRSRTYVDRIAARLGDRLRTGCRVVSVRRHPTHVEVQAEGGEPERFDRVVIAVHSDQAFRLLADPSGAEREILGAIPYQENDVVLHTDTSLLPQARRAWASWNYRVPSRPAARATVTFNLNILQNIPGEPVFCETLNQADDINPSLILRTMTYHHPMFTRAGIRAQERRDEISGRRWTYYCGAYWGYGFHEDGVQSALDVCAQLGCSWERAS